MPRKPQWPGRRSAAGVAPAPARLAGPEPAGPTAGTELTSLLGPVRAGNAFEETVERLLTVIKLGVIPPGDRFPAERELAGLLGVSRITLREAIRALQQEIGRASCRERV